MFSHSEFAHCDDDITLLSDPLAGGNEFQFCQAESPGSCQHKFSAKLSSTLMQLP